MSLVLGSPKDLTLKDKNQNLSGMEDITTDIKKIKGRRAS